MPPPSIDDHVTQLRQELQSQYDQLTARIEALQKDLGRALDGEQKVVLEQRLQDLAAERESLVEQMAYLDQHADEIRAGTIDLPGLSELEPAPGPEPYKGLQVFDVADAAGFFGRERLTAELVDFVRHNSLLAVVGASGSGKSSLVRAGLVSALQTGQPLPDGTTPPEGSAAWPVHIITPSSRPLESLAASLTPAGEPVTAIARLIDDLATDPRSLHLTVRRLLSQSPESPTHLLLIVDQFEELFTLCKDKAQRKAFVDNLLAAACPEPDASCQPAETSTIVVLTLRADFYAQCSEFDNLRLALERYQRYIGAMSKQELQSAIEEPARRGGWELEPGLVDVLLQDVGDEPGALPLLSHALLETWKRRRGRVLTLAGYMASGRVQGALAKTADAVYQRGLTPEQQPIARGIFLRLTELGEGAPDTRRRVSLRELIPQNETAASVRSVLKTLADARLVTTDRDEAEVAHEALIREWPALQEWLAQDREGLRVHRRLTEAAREWEQNGRDDAYLYRGSQLVQTEEWATQHRDDPNQWERAFLDASLALRSREAQEREAQRERELADARKIAQSAVRLRRWALLAAAIGVIALIFAVVAAGFGVQSGRNANVAKTRQAEAQRSANLAATRAIEAVDSANLAATRQAEAIDNQAKAEQQTRRAKAGELAASSLNEWAKTAPDPSLALLLAREAISATRSQDGYVLPNAAMALDTSLRNAPPWRMNLPRPSHTSWVSSAGFSPDGELVVTASGDNTAKVWDVVTDKEVHTLAGHADAVNSAVFSPDGKLVVTASDDSTAKVWNMATGEEVYTLAGHADGVSLAVFSPNGTLVVTASDDSTAKVWDVATGEEVHTLAGHADGVSSPVFSPDGKLVVTASWDGTAKVWDVVKGEVVHTLAGHTRTVYSAVFSPNGKLVVTASGDTTARVWDVATGEEVHTLAGHADWVYSPVFSPNGRWVVTASGDNTAKVWDMATGEEVHTLAGHADSVNSAVFSPNGRWVVTASADNTAKVWDVATGEEVYTLAGHTLDVISAAFSPDGKLVVTSSIDSTVKVWDVATGEEVRTLVGHTNSVNSAVFSPECESPPEAPAERCGKLVMTASADNTAKVWDVATGQEVHTLAGHTDAVSSAVFSPNGKLLVTASWDSTAKVWDVATGEEVHTLAGHAGPVWSAVFSPNGEQVVTASFDNTAKMWDVATGEEVHTLAGHAGPVWSAVFSQDDKLVVTASDDNTAKVWDVATGEEVHTLAGHTDGVASAVFSPDGTLVMTASADNTAKVWDVATAEEVDTLVGHTDAVNSAIFSPNGKLVATASVDNTAKVWDVATGQEVHTLAGHADAVFSAVFSPTNGTLLVTASRDNTAKIWDVATGEEMHTLVGHTGPVFSAVFSPDGKLVLTASDDATARTWYASLDDLLAATERLIQRDPPVLTPAELQRFGLD